MGDWIGGREVSWVCMWGLGGEGGASRAGCGDGGLGVGCTRGLGMEIKERGERVERRGGGGGRDEQEGEIKRERGGVKEEGVVGRRMRVGIGWARGSGVHKRGWRYSGRAETSAEATGERGDRAEGSALNMCGRNVPKPTGAPSGDRPLGFGLSRRKTYGKHHAIRRETCPWRPPLFVSRGNEVSVFAFVSVSITDSRRLVVGRRGGGGE